LTKHELMINKFMPIAKNEEPLKCESKPEASNPEVSNPEVPVPASQEPGAIGFARRRESGQRGEISGRG
jgi:hypothetical protein